LQWYAPNYNLLRNFDFWDNRQNCHIIIVHLYNSVAVYQLCRCVYLIHIYIVNTNMVCIRQICGVCMCGFYGIFWFLYIYITIYIGVGNGYTIDWQTRHSVFTPNHKSRVKSSTKVDYVILYRVYGRADPIGIILYNA